MLMVLNNDKYMMNWTEGANAWGTVRAPKELECKRIVDKDSNGLIHEKYVFTNISDKDVFTSLKDIAIYTTFNDDYTDSATCITNRCHTHIWCGEDITYVMALRMGGEPGHLGMVVTEGSIGGYSVDRDFDRMSNDRGDFMLHPLPVSLVPGESFEIAWCLFEHEGKMDFYEKLKVYCPRYIEVKADNYVLFDGEDIRVEVKPVFEFEEEEIELILGDMKLGKYESADNSIGYIIENGTIIIQGKPSVTGEYSFKIAVKGIRTHCNILVQPKLMELAKARCHFIADKQQFHKAGSKLDGAYLIYDNEEKHMFYNPKNDYNGARERVCMGNLIAGYLRENSDEALEKSLKMYIEYIEREIVDVETGLVFNDYQRDDSYKRLYNYPWISVFYLELYSLYGDKKYLVTAYKVIKAFYEQGGAHFYAIEVPIERIIKGLDAAGGMSEYRDMLMRYFREHCDYIISTGTNYPRHEVNFEQSIVAPAVNILLQMYKITKDVRYLDAAKLQLNVLEMFNGLQPDYHMYEVAIRHWDGYWFGKKKLYGDTYPHYWSALTAHAYKEYAIIMKDDEYMRKAQAAYRAVLSLIFADGSASCAYVYPASVNGIEAGYYDAYANDQDWGLYFMLRNMDEG